MSRPARRPDGQGERGGEFGGSVSRSSAVGWRPTRRCCCPTALIELAVGHKVENDDGIVSEPFQEGRAGKLLRAAKACTAAGAGLTLVAGRTRLARVASGRFSRPARC